MRLAHPWGIGEGGRSIPLHNDEAVCSLVQRSAQDDDRSHLLVRKQYRAVKHRAFRNDAIYRHVTGSSTADKAIRQRTDTGLAILNDVNAREAFATMLGAAYG